MPIHAVAGVKQALRGAMLHALFPIDTTPATTDFACKECTVGAAGKALIARSTALSKIIVKKQRPGQTALPLFVYVHVHG
jgi:hypothetical protein